MFLDGKIVSGFGTAKKWIGMAELPFYEKTGIHLFLGTLNVKLNKKYKIKPNFKILKSEYGGNYDVLVQKCKVFEREAYIIRSEKNINDNGDYGEEIIEIISDISFRQKYNLQDEEKIKIKVEEKN